MRRETCSARIHKEMGWFCCPFHSCGVLVIDTTFTAFFESVGGSIDFLSLISWMDFNALKCQFSLEMVSCFHFQVSLMLNCKGCECYT